MGSIGVQLQLRKSCFCNKLFSMVVSQFSKTTNISYRLICTRRWAYQGVRSNSFTENFEYVLNEWSHKKTLLNVLFAQEEPKVFFKWLTVFLQSINKSSEGYLFCFKIKDIVRANEKVQTEADPVWYLK